MLFKLTLIAKQGQRPIHIRGSLSKPKNPSLF